MENDINPVDMELIEREQPIEEQPIYDPSAVYLCNLSTNPTPEYADPGASGLDIMAYLENVNTEFLYNAEYINGEVIIHPNGRALIPTGLHTALPEGLELQIRPRSGLALKKGITVLNTPGTIDSKTKNPRFKY